MKTISILIPCYNEQESLPALYKRLKELMDSIENYQFEIMFVNDGSRDDTLKIIKDLRAKDSRVNYVDMSRNFGKEIAMIAGMTQIGLEKEQIEQVLEIAAHAWDPISEDKEERGR